jgi:hypothetical protein
MQGHVALLGDSAHAMQPNLGQGGCMAIEDGYQLAIDLVKAVDDSRETGQTPNWERVLEVRPLFPFFGGCPNGPNITRLVVFLQKIGMRG